MHRRLALALALTLLALVATQLILPPVFESRVEDRLTRDGGSAHASLSALPALRLLAGDGDRLDVRARGIKVDLNGEGRVLDKLDGFDEVHVRLSDVSAGPFRARDFELTRPEGESRYALVLHAGITPADLASYAGSQIGGPLGAFLGGLTDNFVPGSNQPVPLDVRAELESRGGTATVVSGGGSVAGIPAGPLLEALAAAVAARL